MTIRSSYHLWHMQHENMSKGALTTTFNSGKLRYRVMSKPSGSLNRFRTALDKLQSRRRWVMCNGHRPGSIQHSRVTRSQYPYTKPWETIQDRQKYYRLWAA